MDDYAVIIVGGGATGLSIAHHLGRLGVSGVAVVERDTLAGGATGRSAGGIRLQFSDAVNIALATYSVGVFERFREEFGVECDFRQYGYLMLATSPADAALFEQNVRLQQSLDVPVRLLARGEIEALVPGLETDDVLCASYCPRDGYADPYSVAMAFGAAARRAGVTVLEHTEVTGITHAGGRVTGVETAGGPLRAPCVVDAAGPWAAEVARLAGVDLPIQPYRRQVFVTGPFAEAPERLPMVIDFRTHFYFRREGAGLLVGMTDLHEPPGFNTNVDWAFLERVVEAGLHRYPPLARATIMRGWAGLYDTTPDNNAILGGVPGLGGFIVAAGFSGHGFMLSPAVGRCIAELIASGHSRTVDIAPFGIGRFLAGSAREERNVI